MHSGNNVISFHHVDYEGDNRPRLLIISSNEDSSDSSSENSFSHGLEFFDNHDAFLRELDSFCTVLKQIIKLDQTIKHENPTNKRKKRPQFKSSEYHSRYRPFVGAHQFDESQFDEGVIDGTYPYNEEDEEALWASDDDTAYDSNGENSYEDRFHGSHDPYPYQWDNDFDENDYRVCDDDETESTNLSIASLSDEYSGHKMNLAYEISNQMQKLQRDVKRTLDKKYDKKQRPSVNKSTHWIKKNRTVKKLQQQRKPTCHGDENKSKKIKHNQQIIDPQMWLLKKLSTNHLY